MILLYYSELETQIKDIVGRIGDGNGLPWPKPQALKIISGEERSRIALLRVLEVRLGMRRQTDTKLSADGEIKPVVSKEGNEPERFTDLITFWVGIYFLAHSTVHCNYMT